MSYLRQHNPATECNERMVICPLEENRASDIMGKKRAKEHYDFIKEQYYKEIDNSITNTTIHACESIEAFKPTYYAWG